MLGSPSAPGRQFRALTRYTYSKASIFEPCGKMAALSLQEQDLLDFFGSPHVDREFGTHWFDSDSLYRHVQSDGLTVTCAVHPIHKDARITLSSHGQTHYDWQATGLADIVYDRDEKSLRFITETGDTLTLRVTPHIAVSHTCRFRRE